MMMFHFTLRNTHGVLMEQSVKNKKMLHKKFVRKIKLKIVVNDCHDRVIVKYRVLKQLLTSLLKILKTALQQFGIFLF